MHLQASLRLLTRFRRRWTEIASSVWSLAVATSCTLSFSGDHLLAVPHRPGVARRINLLGSPTAPPVLLVFRTPLTSAAFEHAGHSFAKFSDGADVLSRSSAP